MKYLSTFMQLIAVIIFLVAGCFMILEGQPGAGALLLLVASAAIFFVDWPK